VAHLLSIAAFAPLALAALALGVPAVLRSVPRPGLPLRATAAIVPLFVFAGAAAQQLDPYVLAILAVTTWAALATAAAAREAGGAFGAADVAVLLLLWVPFDLRFIDQMFPGPPDAAYDWWSVYVVVVAVLAFGRLRELPGFDYRLVPRARDLAVAVAALLAFGAIAVPIGVATAFLRFPPSTPPTFAAAARLGPALFLTVALPEEVLFRATLQAGLERRLGRPRLALVLASLAFGLTHWNNAELAAEKVVYVALATVAGAFYGMAYRRGGSVLAPAICHALVDLCWKILLA
jgi:membrane protease YdiL (CAAX protease family)